MTWQISRRQSISVHTRINKSLVKAAKASLIRSQSSIRSRGNGGTKTLSLTKPHKKKSHGVMSGDLGGHFNNASSSRPVRPIQRCGRCLFKYHPTSLWKMKSWESTSSCVINQFSSIKINKKKRVQSFSDTVYINHPWDKDKIFADKDWFSGFLERNGIALRKTVSLSRARTQAMNHKAVATLYFQCRRASDSFLLITPLQK